MQFFGTCWVLGISNGRGKKRLSATVSAASAFESIRTECVCIMQNAHFDAFCLSVFTKSTYIIIFSVLQDKKTMRVHVFQTTDFSGELIESDEMRPMWYKEDALPFEKMWADDSYWVPYLLANKRFIGRFTYEDDDTIIEHSIREP
jgi:hypothetical protein